MASSLARYYLKIRCKDRILIALPTTTKSDGHNSWTIPNDLIKASNHEAVNLLFNQLTGGLDIDSESRNELVYIQNEEDDGKVYYKTEVVVDREIPVSMGTCSLTRYDKTSNLRIPKYVKFKWVPESELYYWLTRSHCRMEDIRISYFYPDNDRR